MMQEVIVGIVFLAALTYVLNMVVRNFRSKNACSTGCGKCSEADLQKVEAEIKKNGI